MSSRFGFLVSFLALSGFGSILHAQPVSFFVNAETGANTAGCGTSAANPCRSISFLLPTIVLTPTQNALVNVAGRINAAGVVIPYDDQVNGEVFPITLADKISLVYDAVNSEFFPGGARVPAILRKVNSPALGVVVQMAATPGAALGPLTGLDGRTAGAGLRPLHVEGGGTNVLLISTGMTTNDSFVRGVTLRDGANFDLCIRAQDGGNTTTSVFDSTLRTSVNTGTMLDVAAVNPTTPSTATRASVVIDSVAISADQVGGTAVSHPRTGIVVVAQGVTGGSPFVEFEATDVTVSGFTNANPSAPLGLDTGIQFAAVGPDTPRIKASVNGGSVSLCGINGIAFGPLSAGDVGATVSNLRVASCGFRAIQLTEGHGISIDVLAGGSVDVTLQANNIFDHFLDGIFVNPHGDPSLFAAATMRLVSNEVHACGRDGVRVVHGPDAFLTSSTLLSNRIHSNFMKGIRLLTGGSGVTLSPTLVNNLVYGNNGGGIEVGTGAGGSSAVTMTHNTVVDNTGIGVSLVGGNQSLTSFWNGISWHVNPPGGTDFSGFTQFGQINFSTWQTCAVGSTCSGQQNLPGAQPQFVNPAAANYHLVNNDITNPAVDSARSNPPPPAAPQFDFEGDLRVIDIGAPGPFTTLADMGADEARP